MCVSTCICIDYLENKLIHIREKRKWERYSIGTWVGWWGPCLAAAQHDGHNEFGADADTSAVLSCLEPGHTAIVFGKSRTSSSFIPFSLMLDTINLPWPCSCSFVKLALPANLFVRAFTSLLLPAIRSMSSAKQKLLSGLPPIDLDVWRSWSVAFILFSR